MRPGHKSTGRVEWYTPPKYLEAARDVLGGIDLDPASSDAAQQLVQAARYFTKEDNGLRQEWRGRVWLNPPYSRGVLCLFVSKLLQEYRAERVSAAIMLTHRFTDTRWFQEAGWACAALCFTRGRVKFIGSDGSIAAPTQGQAFFYYGDNRFLFKERFREFGSVVAPCGPAPGAKSAQCVLSLG